MIRTMLHLLPTDHRSRVITYTVLVLASAVLRAAGTVVLVPLIAALVGATPAGALPWLGWFTGLTVAGWLVDWVASRRGFDLGFALLDHAQHAVADQLARIRLGWFTAAHTSTARQAVAATGPDLVGLVANLLTPLAGAVLLPFAIALGLLVVDPVLGAAALVGVPILLATLWSSGRLTRNADRESDASNGRLTARVVEFARTQQALRAARRVTPARSAAGAALGDQHRATLRMVLMQVPGQVLFSVASQLCLLLLGGTTVWLAVTGRVGVGEAIALVVVIVRYLEPVTTLSELSPALEHTRGTLRDIRAVLDAPVQPAGTDAAPVPATPRIELHEVGFGWTRDAPVLDGLSLDLAPGSSTAIVGPSGSGKSTLLALLAGLVIPTSGRIVVGGRDMATVTPEVRRAAVSMVGQHPYLFDGSIEDNVRVGRPEAGPDEVTAAFALARVDEIVDRVPDGRATRAGEAGASLSGGERQRVSIARALLKPAPVLLIDEATSALDAENEAAVVRAIADDPLPRTRVIVTHRLSTMAAVDRVVFLERGRIVEDGPPEVLRIAGGRFADFWQQQRASAGWQVTGA